MTRPAVWVRPEDTIQEAAARMRDLGIGFLGVCSHDRIVGVVTDRDITVRATAEGWDPSDATVRRVMTPQVFYCFEDEDVERAAGEMQRRAIRRLLVLDREMRLTGVLSLDDIAGAARGRDLAADVVAHSAHPTSE
jgi:CBS domain-containing protein